MTDVELLSEVSKRFGLKSERLVDQRGRRGIQLKVSGACGSGDEWSFTSVHRDIDEECAGDFLDWLFTRVGGKDSPEKRCGAVCMASSRPELELKLGLAGP